MNNLSFNPIKFFKAKEGPKKRTTNNNPPINKENEINFFERLIKNPFLYLFLFVLVLTYFTSYVPSLTLPQIEVGEIAAFDIVAPADITFEDLEATDKNRKEDAEAIRPIYNLDKSIFSYTEEKIRSLFQSGRELIETPLTEEIIQNFNTSLTNQYGLELEPNELNALIKSNFPSNLEENLISLIGKISSMGIILTKNLFIRGEQEKGFTLVEEGSPTRTLAISLILDIEEAKDQITNEIGDLDLPGVEKSLLVTLSRFFISSNITYDGIATEALKDQARAGAEVVFYTIKKGKIIVLNGDEVNEEAATQIRLINQSLEKQAGWLFNATGTFLLFSLLFLMIWYYLKSLLKFHLAFKYFQMMGLTLLVSLLIYKLSFFLGGTFSQASSFFLLKNLEPYHFALPIQIGILIFGFLSGIQVALIFTVLNSILIGYLFPTNIPLVVFSLIGGFAAIYGVKYFGKHSRTSIFRAGLFIVAPVNIFLIITFHLIQEQIGAFNIFVSDVVMGLIGGLLSASFAFLFLPVLENLFRIITQSKLLELTNSELPIFRKMAIEAPGSFHHSLIVSALAENAAEVIKLDPMLVKAGALYHDVGKSKRPEYFIENHHNRSLDLHKGLKPSMSALVILNHVKEGVEIAYKLKLPKPIRDVIEQHHGTSVMRYFFEKAKIAYDPEMQKIGEESYRYPGPSPQSKEAALVMLADAIEAASRSLKSPTSTNLKRVINDLINNLIQDGQLDDCTLSLKDLKSIATSFLSTLDNIYHQRVEYPGFDFEMKQVKNKKQTKSSNDRNNKPAE
ncbi:MAG: HDIG domain-containing protein [Candidatus Aminicenantes bacterium]|nr:HDIG domain-containing protein [Candidatus Aminicenantes bacterium]